MASSLPARTAASAVRGEPLPLDFDGPTTTDGAADHTAGDTADDTADDVRAVPRAEVPVSPSWAPERAPRPVVEVRRSKRRRRSVSAYREGERTVVLIPARMTRAEEAEWVEVMLKQLAEQERRSKPSDRELLDRAHRLSRAHLDGRAVASSVRWVSNQRTRWGSCTVDDRSVRLSDRLQAMPDWVVDYVLLHELAHLIEPSHGRQFWALLEDYPHLDRARGFLDGWSLALQHAGVPD
jgi:predicted metal-dependent hydrolase